ncbi:MAG: hypothetical protein B6U65_03230 [Candidatus Wolframiiraptor sp. EX4484-121]|nr:MAG: hypothetical protein B6U65_03230 [Candidatus Wolframiiraptor sp. EX4484-121]
MGFDEAAQGLYLAWKRREIELLEPQPPENFMEYILSLRSLWFWLLSSLIAVTLFTIFLASRPPLVYVRYILGSIFVLYLPGSMLIESLYPRGEDLEPLERLALSIGLSLAVVPLIGLVLNYTPWGIRLTPVSISLAIFTEAMATIALRRKYIYFRLSLEGVR